MPLNDPGRSDAGVRRPSAMIQIARPKLSGNELAYVTDCIETGWISSAGQYVERFERSFASDVAGSRFAAACSNGTVALHLALLALGVGPGDEVIVPTLTYVASANAVRYCGATPVFVDVEPDTMNIVAGGGRAGDHPTHQGGHARAPVRSPGRHGRPAGHLRAGRDPVGGGRGRSARCDDRRPPGRFARRHRHVQLLRQQDHHHRRRRDGDDRRPRARRVRAALQGSGSGSGAPLLVPGDRLQLPDDERDGGDRSGADRAVRRSPRRPPARHRCVRPAPRRPDRLGPAPGHARRGAPTSGGCTRSCSRTASRSVATS